MIRHGLTIFLLVFCGSVRAEGALTGTEKLVSLCRIWGYLKYHHPVVQEGKTDWDEQLIRYEDRVQEAVTKEELSEIYLQWIDSLGEVKDSDPNDKEGSEVFQANFDTTWFGDKALFTDALRQRLHFIYRNRSRKQNYYAQKHFSEVSFGNEKEYAGMDYPTANYRLLTLFRYWNIVNYYYPSKYLIGEDWALVLIRFIPVFRDANDVLSYQAGVLSLITSINDSHAFYFNKYVWKFMGTRMFPFGITAIGDGAVIINTFNDSLARIDDIRVGDLLLTVSGVTIKDIISKYWNYIPGANDGSKVRNAMAFISYGSSDTASITFERAGSVRQKTVHRYANYSLFNKPMAVNSYQTKDGYKLLTDGIGYINVSTIGRSDVNKAFDLFSGTRGLILDVRGYPNSSVIGPISGKIHHSRVLFMRSLVPLAGSPGKYRFVENKFEYTGRSDNKQMYPGKVIVLMNESTQSMGEMACMMLMS